MLKNLVRIASTVAILAMLVVGLTPVHQAYAQGGLTWTSGFTVYNPGATLANVSFTYYNQSDGSIAGTASDTINPAASKTYFPIVGVQAGFNGSLVISSDQPLVTVNNLVTPDFHYASATTGFSSGSTTFGIPLVICNNNGWNTFFSVQNAGTGDAHITISYIPGGAGKPGVTDTATITVGASKTFDQAIGSTTGSKTCTDLASVSGGKFVGAASISSDQPVVASIYYLNTTNTPAMSGFNGFAGGSQTVVAPIVMANNGSFWTSIQVQNVGTLSTDVTINYGPNQVVGGYAPTGDTCPGLTAGQSCTKLQSGGQWVGHKYVGSATITSSGQPIVVIVNQVSLLGLTTSMADAYGGFDPNTATATFDAPLIMANNGGFYTGLQAINVGSGTCNVTITYSPNTAGTFAPVPETFSLATNATKTIFQNSAPPGNGSLNNWTGVGKYVGSATANGTGTGCKIVGVINQLGSGGYDKLLTYGGFNR